MIIFMIVLGAILLVADYAGLTKNLEKPIGLTMRFAGAGLFALGLVLGVSVIYLAHNSVFAISSLVAGAIVFVAAIRLPNEKLLWPGVGLFVAGLIMLIVKPGWFLVLILVALAVLAYHKFADDERVKEVTNEAKDLFNSVIK